MKTDPAEMEIDLEQAAQVESPALAGPIRPVPRRAAASTPVRVAVTLVDQGVVSLATFVTGVMISRGSTAGFGMYALVLTLWVFTGEMQNSLVHTPHMLRLPRLTSRASRRFNGSMLIHQLALAAIVTLGLLVASAILWAFERDDAATEDGYAVVTLMTALTLGPVGLRNFVRNVCFATRDAFSALTIDLGVAVVQVGGVAMLAYHGVLHTHWWQAVLVIGAANLLSALAWLAASRERFAATFRRARRDFSRTWKTGRMVFASSMLWVVGGQGYPWMISLIAGHAAAGVWGACSALAALQNPLLMGIQNFMGPAIAHAHGEHDDRAFRRYVLKCSAIFAGLVLPPCLAFGLVAEWALRRLNGPQYAGFGHVSAILASGLVLQGVTFPISRALFSLGRAGLDTLANVGPILVLCTLGVGLVRYDGVHGAAVSMVAAQATSAVLHLLAFLAVTRQPSRGFAVLAAPTKELA